MINNLKKSLKDDIWDKIDGKTPQEREDIDFVKLVFYLMMENNSFLINDVLNISNEIKNLYKQTLETSEQRLLDANGKILSILKEIDGEFDDKIKKIIEKLQRLKRNDR